MSITRSDEALRAARRRLFEALPLSPSCADLLAFQRMLVLEVLETEREKRQSAAAVLRDHLHMVRLYGDALAFGQLSVYAIRQLARNVGKPPDLTGQGRAFDLTMQSCQVLNDNGVPALVTDITNVLRNGDIVICVDENAPQIVECKLSAPKDVRFERQGRRGRQRARIESIGYFLTSGKGRFFGDDTEHQTVELSRRPEYSFDVVDEFVSRALQHLPSTSSVSDFELYSAALPGENVGATKAICDWNIKRGDRFAVGSASEPLCGGWPDIRPPVLWDVSEPVRWALMEGDVELTHAVRVEALVGLHRGDVSVQRAIETPGPFSWGYELMVLGEPLVVSPNMILEVVYAHETIKSAGERLLDLAEAARRTIVGDAV
jgi:hypothetical protein